MAQPDLERLFAPCGNIITSRILCDNITGENSRRIRNKERNLSNGSSFSVSLSLSSPPPPPALPNAGLSKGVGFIRFDQRVEAERAIQKLNGTIPEGASEPITVKFANNPSNNAKAIPPLAAYLAPQAARRAAAFGGALHPAAAAAGRFR